MQHVLRPKGTYSPSMGWRASILLLLELWPLEMVNVKQDSSEMGEGEGKMEPSTDKEARALGRVGGTDQPMEYIISFAKVVKLYQQKNRSCFRFRSPDHLMWDCPKDISKSAWKGDGKERRPDPSKTSCCSGNIPRRDSPSIKTSQKTTCLNPDPLSHWSGHENIDQVRIDDEGSWAVLDNGSMLFNAVTPEFVEACSLDVSLLSNLVGINGFGRLFSWPLGYIIIRVQIEGVRGYNEDQVALVILDSTNFWSQVPVTVGIKEMLEAGAIHPSQSPQCTAAVLVHKKDGFLQFCIDFCKLFAGTKKDCYLLSQIQEAIKSLVGAGYFSCLDLKSGFWKIGMDEALKQYTVLPWRT